MKFHISTGILALMLAGTTVACQPHSDDGPSVLEATSLNMDGTYEVRIERVMRNPSGQETDSASAQLLVRSYGPAAQVAGVPMLALKNRLVTDLTYEEPYDDHYNYFVRTIVRGELTRKGGYFFTRKEIYNVGGITSWTEEEWTLTGFERMENSRQGVRSSRERVELLRGMELPRPESL